MKKCLIAAALLAVPLPALADKLEDLQKQGYVRIAIGNEPPYTAVARTARSRARRRTWPARCSKSWASRIWRRPSPNMAR